MDTHNNTSNTGMSTALIAIVAIAAILLVGYMAMQMLDQTNDGTTVELGVPNLNSSSQ